MSQIQQQQLSANDAADTPAEKILQNNDNETSQMVPVSEPIKYRKRAQAAEQRVEELTGQLQKDTEKREKLQKQLKETKLDREIIEQLAQAGAIDVEVTLLLAQKKMTTTGEHQIDTKKMIDDLRHERPYLFSDMLDQIAGTTAGLTAGVQSINKSGQNNLSRLAKRAQNSGNRKDIQEYLRLRRSVRR